MMYHITEFESFSEMIGFYQQKEHAFYLDLESESPKLFYGLQFENCSIWFASDGLCRLQVLAKDDLICFLVDSYFCVFNSKNQSIKKIELSSAGDTLLERKNTVIVIYETGFFLYNLRDSNHKCIEAANVIYNWKFVTESLIEIEYENSTMQYIDLVI